MKIFIDPIFPNQQYKENKFFVLQSSANLQVFCILVVIVVVSEVAARRAATRQASPDEYQPESKAYVSTCTLILFDFFKFQ